MITCDRSDHDHTSLEEARGCAITRCDRSDHDHLSLDEARQCAGDQWTAAHAA
jgi:hypothetical protein